MDKFGRTVRVAALATLVMAVAGRADAITINAKKTTLNSGKLKSCSNPGTKVDYKDCQSDAHLSKDSLKSDNADYKKAFDAWNGGLADNKKWTLKEGGKLPGGEFTVNTFGAFAKSTVGGMEISLLWDYDGKDKADYLWTSGLYDNYTLKGEIKEKSFFELDNKGSKTSPLYPGKYADRHFYDKPRGPWPNSSFDAYSFLSQVDDKNRVLTIFEGFTWGYQLSATQVTATPEPGSWAVMVIGFGVVGLAFRRGAAPPLFAAARP